MRIQIASTALAALLAMTGCTNVVSLHPLVSDKLSINDPALPGTWLEADGKDTILVRQKGADYAITYLEKNGTAYQFEARLFKVGDARFLDLVTTTEAPFHLPVHFAMRVWVERDTLRMAFLDTDWFKKQLTAQFRTEQVDGRTVLTAPTAAIQSFLERYAGDERAHGDPDTLRRVD